MNCPCRNATRNAGFTLLEMLVVLVILALIAAMATPVVMTPSDRMRLESATSGVLNALRRARSAAVARNAEILVAIDIETRKVDSTAGPSLRISQDVELTLKIADVELSSPSRGAFRFFSDGSSTGGNIILKLGNKTAHICVDWLSGRARQAIQC